jgi:hypothetical protein
VENSPEQRDLNLDRVEETPQIEKERARDRT